MNLQRMQRVLIVLGFWLAAGSVYAQQSAQYTQYIFNGLLINPAYAGTKEIWNANAMYRSQWAGLEGAPTTQTFAADGALKNNRIGVGLQVMNDRVGAQGRLNVLASGAVHLPVSYEGRLSFGLAGGVSQFSLDGGELKTVNPNDPAIPNSKVSSIVPDAQAGVYFHTEQFYAGLSGANLIGAKSDFVLTPERHYFLTSGYVFNLGSFVKFKPSFLLKSDFKAPTNLDLNGFVLFADRLWLGASYRTGLHLLPEAASSKELDMANAMAGIVELYLTKKIKIGYAHDFTLSGLSDYATHEFSVGYYFLKKDDTRMLTPRYF